MRVKSVQNKLKEVENGDEMKIILSNNQSHRVRVKTKRQIDERGREVDIEEFSYDNIEKTIFSIERIPTSFKHVDELPNIHFGDLNPALVSDYDSGTIKFQFSDSIFDVKNINFELR